MQAALPTTHIVCHLTALRRAQPLVHVGRRSTSVRWPTRRRPT
ncbi:Uncharacterised protein [Amycolatopsis camponoti]|uniref:Uncharacterized protein n=1 Tax=Amycolatopsis camponoti TaxID=2606593 RepID=A0A6I8LXA8_9PSEU|nr:Uncharacterised protein [Amycolatopsis camponoti]